MAKVTFDVCYPGRGRKHDNVHSAERSARALCRRHGDAISIVMWTETRTHRLSERVAVIRTDAYGNLWTDLENSGPTLL